MIKYAKVDVPTVWVSYDDENTTEEIATSLVKDNDVTVHIKVELYESPEIFRYRTSIGCNPKFIDNEPRSPLS